MMRKTKLSERLARCSLELHSYDIEIVHRKDKYNLVANALSRRTYPDPPEDVYPIEVSSRQAYWQIARMPRL